MCAVNNFTDLNNESLVYKRPSRLISYKPD